MTSAIAIDWSGAKEGSRRKIWLAEVKDSKLVRLERGRNREEISRHLIQKAKSREVVIGFDFAFSFPMWFVKENGCRDIFKLWEFTDDNCEGWLASCQPPFWGRRGRKLCEVPERFRRTEKEVKAVNGIRPKSVFQINGAGAVGTGSLRGMPILRQLHDEGFSIWPFDLSGWPRVIEIYPRLLTGVVNRSDRAARVQYLNDNFPNLSRDHLDDAISCEDAFDAAISALIMWKHIEDIVSLSQSNDPQILLEGMIWSPSANVDLNH